MNLSIILPLISVSLIAAFVLWGVIYTWTTGKPFIVVHSGSPNPKAVERDFEEVIVDHVSLDHLQGLWRMVSVGRNGNFAPKEVIEKSNFTIAIVANTLTNTSALTMSRIEIKNDVVPNHLDQTDEDGETHLCIVRLRNHHLEMCQGEVGKPRPIDFNRKRRDGASLVLFERIATSSELQSQGNG